MKVFNGPQFINFIQEIEWNEAEHFDEEAPIHERDDGFFVEDDSVRISLIKRR
jgi:hypothetical protein